MEQMQKLVWKVFAIIISIFVNLKQFNDFLLSQNSIQLRDFVGLSMVFGYSFTQNWIMIGSMHTSMCARVCVLRLLSPFANVR